MSPMSPAARDAAWFRRDVTERARVRVAGLTWFVPLALAVALPLFGGCKARSFNDGGVREFRRFETEGEEPAEGVVLPRVEKWNASRGGSAGSGGATLRYRTWWKKTPLKDSVRSRPGNDVYFRVLEFRFEGGAAERETLSALYAFGPQGNRQKTTATAATDPTGDARTAATVATSPGATTALPRPGSLDLVDVLPPAIQALSGHVFEPQSELVKVFGGVKTVSAANCWGTAYEVVRTTTAGIGSGEYVVFYTDRHQADATLRNEGFSREVMPALTLTRGQEPKDAPVAGDPRLPGDVMLIISDFKLGNGTVIQILEHAAVYIDNGIYFEKSNAGPQDPFRLARFEDVVGTYVEGRDRVRLEFRRFDKAPLPHPVKAFGDPAYVALDERYAGPLPAELSKVLRMNREFLLENGEPYNSWSAFFSVRLERDATTGRYALSKAAYDEGTFRFGKQP